MVFEHEGKGYEQLISGSANKCELKFYDEGVQLEEVSSDIAELQRTSFPGHKSILDQSVTGYLQHRPAYCTN